MQTFNILRKSEVKPSFRNLAVVGQYDLQTKKEITETFTGELELSNDWKIGCIVGNSGTGKTTIARELFPEAYIYNYKYGDKSVLDEMPQNKQLSEISKVFNSVGFSSPPSWLKPYSVLSNGEKMRTDLARALLSDNELIVFDEFTSVVDRQVAKTMSHVVNKNIVRSNKKFIAVTCHYDIIEWLQPDWVFDTNEMKQYEVKKNDQTSNYLFGNAQEKFGKCLANIII